MWRGSLFFIVLLTCQWACESGENERKGTISALHLDPLLFDRMKESDQVNVVRRHLSLYAHRALDPTAEIAFDERFPDWRQRLPSDLLLQMDTTIYHISCGRLSYLLRDVYRELGFQSATYNFGIEHTPFTHELTLVELSDGLVSVQDAHYNSALFEGDSLGDFFQFLQAMAGGRAHDFYFINDTTWANLYLPETYLDTGYEICNPAYVSGPLQPTLNPSWYRRDYMVNLQVNLQDSCYGFMTNLNMQRTDGLDFEDLFLTRISSISGYPEWEQRVDTILASAQSD